MTRRAGITRGGTNQLVALSLFEGLRAPPSFSHLATSFARWSVWTSFGLVISVCRNDHEELRANCVSLVAPLSQRPARSASLLLTRPPRRGHIRAKLRYLSRWCGSGARDPNERSSTSQLPVSRTGGSSLIYRRTGNLRGVCNCRFWRCATGSPPHIRDVNMPRPAGC
jgi:hypothetical protein